MTELLCALFLLFCGAPDTTNAVQPELAALNTLTQDTRLALDGEWSLLSARFDTSSLNTTWQDCCGAIVDTKQILFRDRFQATNYFLTTNMTQYFDNLLSFYSPYEIVQTCDVEDVRFTELRGVFNGTAYTIYHYWGLEDATVYELGLYFPQGNPAEPSDYAASFGFEIISCPEEAQ